MERPTDGGNVLADAVIGAVAGAAAVWVMDRVDWFNFLHVVDPEARRRTQAVRPGGMDPAHVAADRLAHAMGRELEPRDNNPVGKAIHYSIGIGPAVAYNVLRHRVPAVTTGRGSLFGLSLFLMQDEGLNALTGLSAPQTAYPWQAHARGLAAHLTYGLVTDALCRFTDAWQDWAAMGAVMAGQPERQLSAPEPVRYHPSVETIEPGEEEVFDRIIAVMRKGGEVTRERYGRSVRTSHAKAHGLLRGEMQVLGGLPRELRQGLFTTSRSYPAIVRLAHVPGELLDDRKVSTPRGMALKILDVDGEMLSQHQGERTQDWVLDTGKVFIAPGAKTFLAQITATEAATALPESVKGAVSTASLAANKALHAVGLDSANLDFYGHPPLHPLGEAYYSQAPLRYGDYIAKLAVFPDNPPLRDLVGETIVLDDEDALRMAVQDYFRTQAAEYVVAVQLCTDLQRMPVENANVEWPEGESPYRPVARLVLPPQDAFSGEWQDLVDESLSFCPAHSLAAHRPLGSIMRARMRAYDVLGRERREQNGRPTTELRSANEVPAQD